MTLPSASPKNKVLVLGTALWGWGIDRSTAYRLLDLFAARGGRSIDTATNYPINKCPQDFGLAINWLADWVAANGESTFSILVKIGAKDNSGSPVSNLGAPFVLNSAEELRSRFGRSLAGVSVHWDNRGAGDSDAIRETVHAFASIKAADLSIGLSGIQYPEFYLNAEPSLARDWWIQVKENALTAEARLRYHGSFPDARYLAYGINMGGLKMEPAIESSSVALRGIRRPDALIERMKQFLDSDNRIRPAPKDLNDLALLGSYINTALSGVIIGPRTVEQLEFTLDYWKQLNEHAPNGFSMQLPAFRSLI